MTTTTTTTTQREIRQEIQSQVKPSEICLLTLTNLYLYLSLLFPI